MCGIYFIKNIINNKIYVGSSKDINCRIKRHKSSLKNNKHYNILLQRSYNKYGQESFEYLIIEIVFDIKSLISREQYYISKYKSYKRNK